MMKDDEPPPPPPPPPLSAREKDLMLRALDWLSDSTDMTEEERDELARKLNLREGAAS